MPIKSFQLITNNICYGPAPNELDEVEQHLTVSMSGRVWFSARNYDQYLHGKGFCRKKQLDIGTWKAQYLISRLEKQDAGDFVTDCGTYELEIRYDDNTVKKKIGALSHDDEALSISRLLRRYIPVYSLWGIDSLLAPDYEGKKAVFLFADRWIRFFQSEDKSEHEFSERFGEECIAQHFQMDCAHEFERRYPGCFKINHNKLKETIVSIVDVDLLGSAVFSQWRYLTHWSMGHSLDKDTCNWFITILSQMRELCKNKSL